MKIATDDDNSMTFELFRTKYDDGDDLRSLQQQDEIVQFLAHCSMVWCVMVVGDWSGGDGVEEKWRGVWRVCVYKKGVYIYIKPSGGEKYSNGSETARAPEQPAWDLYTNRHASPDS